MSRSKCRECQNYKPKDTRTEYEAFHVQRIEDMLTQLKYRHTQLNLKSNELMTITGTPEKLVLIILSMFELRLMSWGTYQLLKTSIRDFFKGRDE